MLNASYTPKKTLKVVAQKADPDAVIEKGRHGFSTTIICVMEDGTERKHRINTTRKRDLAPKLAKLPIEKIRGMELAGGMWSIEIFGYNGV